MNWRTDWLTICLDNWLSIYLSHLSDTFSTSERPKVLQKAGVLWMFTSKCASRQNGVHFFDIYPSESAPNPTRFFTFWLENVLPATAACHFSTSQLPKSGQSMVCFDVFCTFDLKMRFGVQFFISPLARWLRTRRFSEPTFWPSRPTNH